MGQFWGENTKKTFFLCHSRKSTINNLPNLKAKIADQRPNIVACTSNMGNPI